MSFFIKRLATAIWIFLLIETGWSGEFWIIDGKGFPKIGMFSMADQILGHLFLFETQSSPDISGLQVDFGEFGLYYDPRQGSNWWNYYFEPLSIGNEVGSKIKHASRQEGLKALGKRKQYGRSEAAAMVAKYIRVRPHIQEKVDRFAARYFQGCFTIGIHYRGTDKYTEAPRVSYSSMFNAARRLIPQDAPYQFFIATDEAPFLAAMRTAFPGRVIALEIERANGTQGLHFEMQHSYETGEAALMDALLLSKCNLLIRTSSKLSLWSTFFNPDLPVFLLNYDSRKNKAKELE